MFNLFSKIRVFYNKNIWPFCVVVILLSCGTWAGNPKKPDDGDDNSSSTKALVQLDITSKSSNLNLTTLTVPVVGVNGSDIGNFVFSSAYVVVKDIELRKIGESSDGELDFQGPFVVNLLNNSMTPADPSAQISEGFYDRIKVKLEKLDIEDASQADENIVGRSIYLSGSYNSGNATTNIVMTFELSEEFEVKDDVNGIRLESGSSSQLLIQFDLAKWLDFSDSDLIKDGVDFSNLSGSSVVLSEDSSDETMKSLHEAIKESIKGSADFGKDLDGDGSISDDEREQSN